MNISRTGVVGLVIVLAVILQVAVFNLFSVNGVVPNLAMIVVVAAAIARGPQFGVVVGFVATVAVCSFIATSVFALSGVVLGDQALPPGEMVQVICVALLWDVVVTPLLLPGLMTLFERTRPAELAY